MRILILATWMLTIAGCGGRQASSEKSLSLIWGQTVGGAYHAACMNGDTGWAARRYSVEKWSITNDRPMMEKRIPFERIGNSPGVDAIQCSASHVRVKAKHTPFRWLNVDKTPQESADMSGVAQTLTDEIHLSMSMGTTRRLEFRRSGHAVLDGDRFVDWRPVQSDIRDAIYDGRHVWAVSKSELWRWTPYSNRILSVSLPTEIGQRELVSLFRDGPVIWLRTHDDNGWPLLISGGLARLAGQPGPLPPLMSRLSFPLGRYRVELKGQGHPLRLIDEDGGLVPFSEQRVDGLLPLTRAHLLVSLGDAVELWNLGVEPPFRLEKWSFGGPVVRFFLDRQNLIAIGRNTGFHWGQIRR